ncbi:ribosome modulation factor [Methylobacterium gossipiicola]|uniref:ribosome modulation factor n=1 Tax=Methylobacterium gossipiicola TaxID=582675 RepID=UPI001FCE1A3B|nr:Rmf/CrpP family protein [Methylobacterium gossipiicola]
MAGRVDPAPSRHGRHRAVLRQDVQARIHGRPKDACPYPAASEARAAWMEGYDGMPRDEAPASTVA